MGLNSYGCIQLRMTMRYTVGVYIYLLHLLRTASLPGCPIGDTYLLFESCQGLLLIFAAELYLADVLTIL